MQVKRNHKSELISKETIIAYLQNKLSNDEKNSFENQLKDDVFLQDALEGYKLMPSQDIQKNIDTIVSDIDLLFQSKRKKPALITLQTRPMAIAALLLVFIGIAWFSVWFATKDGQQQIAKTEEVHHPEMTTEQRSENTQLKDETASEENKSSIKTEVEKITERDEKPSVPETKETEENLALSENKIHEGVNEKTINSASTEAVPEPAISMSDTFSSKSEIQTATSAEQDDELSEVVVTENTAKKDKRSNKNASEEKKSVDMDQATSTGALAEGISQNNEPVYKVVDLSPEFPGGIIALQKYILEHLTYPEEAKESNIQGTVYITFTVLKSGKITDTKILKGLGYGCDEEAIKIISEMPDWKAGILDGIPVNCSMTIPIKFIID